MEGKIFRITYLDDRDISRRKWIVFKEKDAHLLWYFNPLHDLKVESVPLESIQRMEEQEFSVLVDFMKQNNANFADLRLRISQALEESK